MQAIDYLHCKAISYLAFLKLIYMYILLQNSTKTFHTVATYGLEWHLLEEFWKLSKFVASIKCPKSCFIALSNVYAG
jgi:hypothetical protein